MASTPRRCFSSSLANVPRAVVAEATSPPPPELPPQTSIGALIGHTISIAVEAMREHEPGVREGADPDHVRKTRVAVRRLRSNLRTFGGFLRGEAVDPLIDELGVLGTELGRVRDREVLQARLRGRARVLPEADRKLALELVLRLQAEIAAAREEAVRYLDSERYPDLLGKLGGLASEPPLAGDSDRPALEVAGELAREPWLRLRRGVRKLGRNPQDEELHRARILAKRSRYAATAVAPVVGARAADFARAAAGLQDVLGEHQDAVTAETWLAAAPVEGRAAFVAGQLAGLERAAAVAAREKWKPAWAELDREELRAWMDKAPGGPPEPAS